MPFEVRLSGFLWKVALAAFLGPRDRATEDPRNGDRCPAPKLFPRNDF